QAALLHETVFTQSALFAIEVALSHLVEHWGLSPDLLLGHSIGELAAAHVAEVLSLADACTLVAARGGLMQALPSGGAMVSLQASEEETAALISTHGNLVSLAAVNGPRSVVIAGDRETVEDLAEQWQVAGGKAKRLRVSHA